MAPAGTTPVVPWSDDRLELGEGARWLDGSLYLVDMLAGRLLVADPGVTPSLREVLRVDGPLGAVAARRNHPDSWLLATGTGIALVDAAGSLDWLDRPEADNAASVRMNDGAVDIEGRFWAGSMADDGTVGAGSLYRVDHDGAVIRVLDGLSIVNGPAFSPDGRFMYLADSSARVVYRFAFDAVNGVLGARVTFARFGVGAGLPDGMTVDVEGALWVAVWGGGVVHRYRPDGKLDRVIRLPAAQPTSVCLGGMSGRELFITSATVGLTHPGAADGALFSIIVDVPGLSARPAVLR